MGFKLSCHWQNIQDKLFPHLTEALGPLSEKHQMLMAVLDFVRPEKFLRCFPGRVGRPQKNRCALARAFLAKAVFNLPTTQDLIDRLHCDGAVRRMCG